MDGAEGGACVVDDLDKLAEADMGDGEREGAIGREGLTIDEDAREVVSVLDEDLGRILRGERAEVDDRSGGQRHGVILAIDVEAYL